MSNNQRLSIIIPTYREAATIEASLAPLQVLRRQRCVELILVDGGSDDATCAIAEPLVDVMLTSRLGRARQMNAGAARASGDLLLFLHADTFLPEPVSATVDWLLNTGHQWGFFRLALTGQTSSLRLVQFMINWRTGWSSVGSGDQAIFVQRDVFERVGGYQDIPLMEDIALTGHLKTIGAPSICPQSVLTSSRRWQQKGVWRTILLMWRLRLSYYLGVEPEQLVRRYYPDYVPLLLELDSSETDHLEAESLATGATESSPAVEVCQ